MLHVFDGITHLGEEPVEFHVGLKVALTVIGLLLEDVPVLNDKVLLVGDMVCITARVLRLKPC